ncbi:MAG: hypothetical protein NWP69_04055, partial [Congregibacter sp.]|nr:hypothetical protein [Congregibacter sp.]
MGVLHSEIRQRLTRQFQLLAQGEDAPPGPRYRLEGLMEAAVMTGEVAADTLRLMIAERHLSVLGETVE